ncbi:MAG: serine/threonine-protein phosphatase [Phycisphaerales bacterium]|nr:serine/threonine-protein phosphatase [Phycisphaerales bacterium]
MRLDTALAQLETSSQALFRSEYEMELEGWLRRRLRSVGICYLILTAVVLVQRVVMILNNSAPTVPLLITVIAALASTVVIANVVWARHTATATRPQLLRSASTMILFLGAISLTKSYLLEFTSPVYRTEFIVPLFFWHFIACLFLPWTPRESLRPVIPLLLLWALGVMLHFNAPISDRVMSVTLSPLVVMPGLGISAIRLHYHGERFRERMVGKHFLSMRQELARARAIHESMFPPPHDDGYVRFEYTYRPMRDLGGDYVHLDISPDGLIHLTLIDVTGHGLAAALTVNRLYGELERIRAESPGAEPGEVLALFNRYIHLTLVKHNIYATALCLTLDPYLAKLHWASAGHPPAFLRGVNGAATPLAATTVLLGALDSNEFNHEQRTIELAPGDVIVAYTDGAYEARDRMGRQLGLDHLDQLVRTHPSPRHWPPFIASAVQKHTAGRAEDDVLIAALTFKAQRPTRTHSKTALAAS